MKRKKSGLLMAAVGILVAASIHGCGGGGNQQPGATTPAANFTGKFQGTGQINECGNPFQENVVLTLTQNGSQVIGSGTGSVNAGGPVITLSSSISGTASGNVLNFNGSNNAGLTFSGQATLNGDRLTGELTSSVGGQCPGSNETFDLTRQQTPAPAPSPTVTTTPALTCAGVDQTVAQVVDSFSPQSSNQCNSDSDCVFISAEKRNPGTGLCAIKCVAGTPSEQREWQNFMNTDPELAALCQERASLSCGNRQGTCGQVIAVCENHQCVSRHS